MSDKKFSRRSCAATAAVCSGGWGDARRELTVSRLTCRICFWLRKCPFDPTGLQNSRFEEMESDESEGAKTPPQGWKLHL